jgi:hypothetical protein
MGILRWFLSLLVLGHCLYGTVLITTEKNGPVKYLIYFPLGIAMIFCGFVVTVKRAHSIDIESETKREILRYVAAALFGAGIGFLVGAFR